MSSHLITGINLFTPLGSLPENPFKSISYVSGNTCMSLSVEYKKSWFGLKVPVRIPLTQGSLPETPEESWEWYSWYNRPSNTNYEVGILPTFYFYQTNKFFQPFTYFGVCFGNAHSYLENSYEYNSYDNNSGTYINYETMSYSFEELGNFNYQRYVFGTGVQLQWKSGFGIQSDLAVFRGNNRQYAYANYSNYGTTDGAYFLDYEGSSQLRVWGVQLGLSLTYRVF